MKPSESVTIIGFGNMGKALARGLQRQPSMEVVVCDRFAKPTPSELATHGLDPTRTFWVQTGLSGPLELPKLASEPKAFVLATKPQNLDQVMDEWRTTLGRLPDDAVFVSILAGIPTSVIESKLGTSLPVVRAMPNIAATVDQAATVLCAGQFAAPAHVDRARAIFDAVGRTWICHEDHLNAVTGLSGSGPAYIYMVIEALSDGGVKMGLPRNLALELATQTVIGAGILVKETGIHPAVLRDQVTTPGGTTISAIHELERHGLRAMLIQAVVTASRKSAQLLAKSLGLRGST
jgi:pyrroline-5-carboxylate reductase